MRLETSGHLPIAEKELIFLESREYGTVDRRWRNRTTYISKLILYIVMYTYHSNRLWPIETVDVIISKRTVVVDQICKKMTRPLYRVK
jgi:hypothetical protein